MSTLISLMLLALVAGVLCDDGAADVGGVYLKVLGQSGKIMVGKTENPADDPDRIMVEMDSLKEVDDQGTEVGKTGTPKHSFNSFASQSFIFSELEDTTFEEIGVKQFSFETTLSGLPSKLKVIMMIFKEDGNFTYADETQTVSSGLVKFSIELTDWQFCDPSTCTKGQSGETGEYIDFTITIKGKGQASKRASGGSTNTSEEVEDDLESYNFETGSFRVSEKVEVDGVWTDMTTDYPKLVTQGTKQQFVFRFPKFTNKVYYDPSIAYGTESGCVTDCDGTAGGTGGCALLGVSIMVTILMGALATIFTM